jgi:hypothetical protein
VCFLISIAACAFLIVCTTLDYLGFDVATQIQVVDVSGTGLDFPQVDINSMRFFASPVAQANLLQSMRAKFGQEVANVSDVFTQKRVSEADYLSFITDTKATLNADFTNAQKQALGYGQSNTILSCKYNTNECNSSQIKWFFDRLFGNSYSFVFLF